VTWAVVVGLLGGSGALLLASGISPRPVPLGRALAMLHEHPAAPSPGAANPTLLVRLLGQSWERSDAGRRLTEPLTTDLRIVGETPAEHLAKRVAYALVALLWAPLVVAVMSAGGVRVGVVFPLWASLLMAPIGFLLPSLQLRTQAAERRRSFRHALGAFLDVVSISLAGGRGVDSALHEAAEAGQGWVFHELRHALLESRLLGETPWAGMARLGHDLDIPDLGELAASASLAGSEGARVKASLAAKARAIRLRGLTEIEASAQSASERMSLPVVCLMVGFIVFLGYPAVAQVLYGI
jgi:Flp pilus assembly protein TadB